MKGTEGDRGIRRMIYALTLAAATLAAAGGLTNAIWLIGVGVWALIAAFLIEMIYRP